MPLITTKKNIKIHYEIGGVGDPMVLIPGVASDHTTWGLFKSLLEKCYTIIAIDNRGTGKSSLSETNYTIEDMADDLHEVLKSQGKFPYLILGHSLGSYVAQYYAARYSQNVKKLILISTRKKSSEIMRQHYDVTFALIKQNIAKEILIKNSMCLTFSEDFMGNQDHVDNYIKNMANRVYPISLKGLVGQIHAANQFDNIKWLPELKSQTCFIHGSEDRIAPLSQAMDLQKNIPESILKVIPDTGHIPHLEKPEIVLSEIQAFLH